MSKKLKVKNLKPQIMEFAGTLPPVDNKSDTLKNRLIDVVGEIGSFRAIDLNGRSHEVDFVGNWGRLYLGHQFGKIDLDRVDLVYRH